MRSARQFRGYATKCNDVGKDSLDSELEGPRGRRGRQGGEESCQPNEANTAYWYVVSMIILSRLDAGGGSGWLVHFLRPVSGQLPGGRQSAPIFRFS